MTSWLSMVHPKTTDLLETLSQGDGAYRYSRSGDLFPVHAHTNLAASIFALKLFALLGIDDATRIRETANRVCSFQTHDGSFVDPFVLRKRYWRSFAAELSRGRFPWHIQESYIRAETRQAYSALSLHNALPSRVSAHIPTDPDTIKTFLHKLDWSRPWGAGSHFSHLLFFLELLHQSGQIEEPVYRQAQEVALSFLASIEHSNDGAWYTNQPSAREKINGAMKILTGLTFTNKQAPHPEALIDFCLAHPAQAKHDACNQINQILVLRYADAWCDHTYRSNDIRTFCETILEDWQPYFYPSSGGFSFHRGAANQRYYGAKITKGFNEPDIHATTLFVWGLSLMKHLLPHPELQLFHDITV